MATNQVATVPKLGFMDLPPEMRNLIYGILTSNTWDSPVITTDKLNCKSIFDLVLSLGLHKYFPLLATCKQVMHEVLAFCLENCTLRVENLDQLNAIRAIRHTSAFQQLRAAIRSVALDISWYSHGIDNPLNYHPRDLEQPKTKTLIPMSRLHLRCSCCSQDFFRSTSFVDLIAELALLFPNITSLSIDFDKTTFSVHKKFRNDILAMPWPTLREIKFRRPDLERQSANATEQALFFNCRSRYQAAVWPPQRVPWQLEMDFGYLEVLNEILEKDMRRKIKLAGGDARTPFSWGPD